MGLLDKLLRRNGAESEGVTREEDTIRKIVGELDALPTDRARHIAAFAYLLGRVAHADLDISADETGRMEQILQQHAGLSSDQAILVVQIAKSHNRLFGGTENFVVTREFKEISTTHERTELLRALFAVSAADDSISGEEEAQIRQIASELDLSLKQFTDIRREFAGYREILKPLREDD